MPVPSMNAGLMAEFQVAGLLTQAEELLGKLELDNSSARLLAAVREAKRVLHPATSDPKLKEQFEQESAPPPPAPAPSSPELPPDAPPLEQPPTE